MSKVITPVNQASDTQDISTSRSSPLTPTMPAAIADTVTFFPPGKGSAQRPLRDHASWFHSKELQQTNYLTWKKESQ